MREWMHALELLEMIRELLHEWKLKGEGDLKGEEKKLALRARPEGNEERRDDVVKLSDDRAG